MKDLSEYFPLLIIIVSIIISAISGSKKKKASQKTYIPGIPQPEQEEQFYEYEPDFEIEPEIESLQKKNKKQPISPIDSNRKFHTKLPSSTKTNVSEEDDTNMTLEEYSKPSIDISDLDEVKKAVIYTEIFNRKNY